MKKKILVGVLSVVFTVLFTVFYFGCDETPADGTVSVVLTGASSADSQSLYAYLYANGETDLGNPAKLLATNKATISGGAAAFVLQVTNGAWQGNGTDWLGTAGISYDVYIYTDANADGDNEPDTHSGSPVPKMTSPYPVVVTIADAQTVAVAYSDMVDYDYGFSDGTLTMSLSGASAADTQVFYAYLYAEDETDLNNPDKLIATNQVTISGGTASFTLEESDGAWFGNGTDWVGTGGTNYDLYIYTDGNDDGDYDPETSSGVPMPMKTSTYPMVVEIDDINSIALAYSDMVEYTAGPHDGKITVSLTGASAADTQGLYAFLFADGETVFDNPALLIATNQIEISGGTASFTLEESDGSTWFGNGTEWIGTGGTGYDLYIYIDGNVDGDNDPETNDPPATPAPRHAASYPVDLSVDASETLDISYDDMDEFPPPPAQ